MPNDNFRFPQRMAGYGAYNLCFDKLLGQPRGGGKNFFEYIRARPRWDAINLVKVICFRQATLEGLPAIVYENGVATGRTQPLYNRNGTINSGFLDNLSSLVDMADTKGFWVQVCIFHEQAIKPDTHGVIEPPENVPAILDPTKLGTTTCERLTKFFTINDADRLAAQKQLVAAIAFKLRMKTNVLFEIANEVRIQGCADAAANAAANCKVVAWLNVMSDQILSSIFWDHEPDCTSTGTANEGVTFDPVNRRGCSEPYFRPTFFDFHYDQWAGSVDGIEAARNRVATNYLRTSPVPARLPLIINDDGAKFGDELTDAEKIASARLIETWARGAFQKGLHYASKQQYPPGREWDSYALDAIANAATVPIPG